MNTVYSFKFMHSFFWSYFHILRFIFKYFTKDCFECVEMKCEYNCPKVTWLRLESSSFFQYRKCFSVLGDTLNVFLSFSFFNTAFWQFHLHPEGSLDCTYTAVCLWQSFCTEKALSIIFVCNVQEYRY